jgi:hypothetical protein
MSVPLPASDFHRLSAAEGWLELNNHLEANLELESISPEMQEHPSVLMVKYQLFAKVQRWDVAFTLAQKLVSLEPDKVEGWVLSAYSARRREGGGLLPAWNILISVVEKFPDEPVVPYNLACYACQFGRTAAAVELLERVFKMPGGGHYRKIAREDEDLVSIRREIARL